jgi:hypothetical protein
MARWYACGLRINTLVFSDVAIPASDCPYKAGLGGLASTNGMIHPKVRQGNITLPKLA